ncbi:MAG: branched-chain amino acid ABC transporter permease [Pseudomonadales bacterium]|nr:branched-chain amino acid ABC transporter permease [Pseudomonadales bacterium]
MTQLIAQATVNAIVGASYYFLVALGFGLVFWSTRFFNFSHGAIITIGGYVAYSVATYGAAWPIFGVIAAIGLSALSGVAFERSIFRRIRESDGSNLVLMMASLGVYMVVQNLISMLYGDDAKGFGLPAKEGLYILSARITLAQLATVSCALGTALLSHIILKTTRYGRYLRALAENPYLAMVKGIPTKGLIVAMFFFGSGLAGLVGVLVGYDLQITPTMGFRLLLPGIVVLVVAGARVSILSVLIAALAISTVQQAAIVIVDSRWNDAILFAILVLALIVRPGGVEGSRSNRIGLL